MDGQTLLNRIRTKYKGSYDDLSDVDLAKKIYARYPKEYPELGNYQGASARGSRMQAGYDPGEVSAPRTPSPRKTFMRAMNADEKLRQVQWESEQQRMVDQRLSYDPSDPLGKAKAMAQRDQDTFGGRVRGMAASAVEPQNLALSALGLKAFQAIGSLGPVGELIGGTAGVGFAGAQGARVGEAVQKKKFGAAFAEALPLAAPAVVGGVAGRMKFKAGQRAAAEARLNARAAEAEAPFKTFYVNREGTAMKGGMPLPAQKMLPAGPTKPVVTPESQVPKPKGKMGKRAGALDVGIQNRAREVWQEVGGKADAWSRRMLDEWGPDIKPFLNELQTGLKGAGASASQAAVVAAPTTLKPLKEEDPAKRIGKLLSQAKPDRRETERLYSAERGLRAKRFGETLGKNRGQSAFDVASRELEGELPYAEFKPIREHIRDDEYNSLFDRISDHEPWHVVGEFNKKSTADALKRLLDPQFPKAPRDFEIELLEEVFGPEIVKPFKRTNWGKELTGVVNLPKALMASFDRSAALRQGLFYTLNHPVKASKDFIRAERAAWGKPGNLKALVNEGALETPAFQEMMAEMRQRPNARLYHDSGLAIAGLGSKRVALQDREEAFMSKIAEALPWVRNSERAYTGYLNQARADYFDMLSNEAMKAGITPDKDPQAFKNIANFVNITTGRGNLGAKGNQAAPFLNMVLFSPRYVVSRFQTFNPLVYGSLPPGARKAAAKDLVRFTSVSLAALYMIKKRLQATGEGDVEVDPRSSDFGKIRIGDTRTDALGGYAQVLRIPAQIISGQRKSLATKRVAPAQGIPYQTFRTKSSPSVGYALSAAERKTVTGEEFSAGNDALRMLSPLAVQDMYQAVKEHGAKGLAYGIPTILGAGSQTFEATEHRKVK